MQLDTVLQAVQAQKVSEVKPCDSNNNAPLLDPPGVRDPLLATTPVAPKSMESIWDTPSSTSTPQSLTRSSRTEGGVSAPNGSVCYDNGSSVIGTEAKGSQQDSGEVDMEEDQEKVAHEVDEQQRGSKTIESDDDSSSQEENQSYDSDEGTDREKKEDELREAELGAAIGKLDKFVSNVDIDEEMATKLEDQCAIVVETEETLNDRERQTTRFRVVDQTLTALTDLQKKEKVAEEEYVSPYPWSKDTKIRADLDTCPRPPPHPDKSCIIY